MSNRGKNRTPTARRADLAAAPALAAPVANASPSPSSRPGTLWVPRLSANWIISLLLAGSVFLVFGQTARHKFINLDDNEYVYENREVRTGLTLHGLRAAFLQPLGVNWHPLTTLSHMLDCQIYGLDWPGGHHLTNVALHAATAIGLYLVLRQMTGRTACSAFVAFFFALHPLRVESVAWIAERKDVLSGLFFVVTLAAYLGYVRRPSFFRYLLVSLVFALGLMCKPMLVTLPFLLLLLDYWPLGRLVGWACEPVSPIQSSRGQGARSPAIPLSPSTRLPALLLEKLPLFILSACSCAITLVLQASAMPPFQRITLAQRLGTCLLAYAGYLKMLIWPFGLAVYYPYSEGPPNPWAVAAAGALLTGITTSVWVGRRRHPYLLVGWLWYLGTLVPVIGLIQVGYQSMADRYTYLPMIGLVIALVWLAADAAGPSVNWRFASSVAGSLVLLILAACTAWQTAYWRDDFALWTRTLNCTAGNYVARMHLGLAWTAREQPEKAIEEYDEAIRLLPGFREARFNLACALSSLGRMDAAQQEYESLLRIAPNYAKAHNNLGMLLLNRGEIAAASEHFQKALDADPRYAMAENNLGITLMAAGHDAAAAEHYRRAIDFDPDFPQPHANLGHALGQMGEYTEAAAELRAYLKVQPDNAQVLGWLAWVLATARDNSIRNGSEALALASKAAALSRESNPRILDTLAAAYAETGQFQAAIRVAESARDLAISSGQTSLAAEISARIDMYRQLKRFRE